MVVVLLMVIQLGSVHRMKSGSQLTTTGSPFSSVINDKASGSFVVNDLGRFPANVYQCPKPSRAEKEAGCEGLESVVPPAVQHQKDTKPNKWGKRHK